MGGTEIGQGDKNGREAARVGPVNFIPTNSPLTLPEDPKNGFFGFPNFPSIEKTSWGGIEQGGEGCGSEGTTPPQLRKSHPSQNHSFPMISLLSKGGMGWTATLLE